MNEPILTARVERGDGGRLRVLAPLVGIWSGHPHAGALLGPGSGVGLLAQLNRRFRLVLPDGAAGRVWGAVPRDRTVPVEYGEPLFELLPVRAGSDPTVDDDAASPGRPTGADLAPGLRAVVSPTDGVFYRRPAPGAAPFLEVGARVREGEPIGLVEVMKTFNQILYGGPGFPEEGDVVEIRCADAEEVRAGQILVVVR